MKEHRHLGAYGLVVKNDKILLIKKVSGPYDGLLDLPGGGLKFGETPEDALKRELLEETGIEVEDYELFDATSVTPLWQYNKNTLVKVHHTGIFYKVNSYKNKIKKNIEIDEVNDDSKGAEFYKISNLTKDKLSKIAIVELEKLGYKIQ